MNKNNVIIYSSVTLLVIIVIFTEYLFFIEINEKTNYKDTMRVIDGDTFEYNGEVIRLICVDTPENGDLGYAEAIIFLSNLLYGEDIELDRHGLDKYNRTLAYVYVDDLLINREIVDKGYGSLFVYGNESCEGMKWEDL